MTPCEEKGYKIGDRFRQVNTDGDPVFSVGAELILTHDDETHSPEFVEIHSGDKSFEHLGNVELLTPQWRGPQDGVPPVGSTVRLIADGEDLEVMCHGAGEAFCGKDSSGFIGIFGSQEAEPVPSDRDRAIDALLPAIREAALRFGFLSLAERRDFGECLYDLGIRKKEES